MSNNLYKSHKFFEIICNNSNLIVLITDKKGSIVFVNDKFTEVSGYTPEEAIGKNPRMLSAGVLPENFYKDLWETLSEGKNWEGVFINKKKDGSIYYESATISPIKNNKGEIEYFVAIKHEITEREDLIDATTKHLSHYIPLGILVLDHEDKIVFVNKGTLKIFKSDLTQLLNKKINKVLQISRKAKPVDLTEQLKNKNKVTLEEAIIFYGETTIFANITAIKITKSSSQIGTIVIIEDISEKKEIEEKQKRLAEIEKLSVFLMGFGHDFNNLLAITQIQLQSAEMYLEKDINKAKEKLKNVSEKLNEISKLISSFFETATSKPVFVKTNINAIVKSIVHNFAKQFNKIIFEIKEKEKFIIPVDREKIRYTLEQIIKNAIEAQDNKGKVEIQIEKASLPEILSLRFPLTDYAKITIKDYGKGIKKEYLPLLFTPYFTTKERTSEKQTGLSLAICNFNVQKHGGHIKVITEEGKGSEFIIYLPFSPKDIG